MQYDENAEKYGYEGEMTPLKCDELKAYKGDVYIPVYGSIADAQVYLKEDVDASIAELKEALRDHCTTCPVKMQEDDAVAELKNENRRLRRALYKACANWAHFAVAFFSQYSIKEKWYKMKLKCQKKAKEYK